MSDHCVESNIGTGKMCCANACADVGAASCGMDGTCDSQTFDCAVHDGTQCGAPGCFMGMLTDLRCHGGSCQPSERSNPCPGGLGCQDAATCKTSCMAGGDCATTGAICMAGLCTNEPPGAVCGDNSQCASGVCGTNGKGHCCSAACKPMGGVCGATDCGVNGACVFPDPTTPCGPSSSCMESMLTSDYCDGAGACSATEQTKPCPGGFNCANSICDVSCPSNDDAGDRHCASFYWCDGAACRASQYFLGSPCVRNAQCLSDSCTVLGCWL